ncbi:hypothetical protein B0H12DRAFT_1111039 [Mycena haematopus]|nr:hypothetical protein B0H12DRAFT_1111039 [Mycena haematopus]
MKKSVNPIYIPIRSDSPSITQVRCEPRRNIFFSLFSVRPVSKRYSPSPSTPQVSES